MKCVNNTRFHPTNPLLTVTMELEKSHNEVRSIFSLKCASDVLGSHSKFKLKNGPFFGRNRYDAPFEILNREKCNFDLNGVFFFKWKVLKYIEVNIYNLQTFQG